MTENDPYLWVLFHILIATFERFWKFISPGGEQPSERVPYIDPTKIVFVFTFSLEVFLDAVGTIRTALI